MTQRHTSSLWLLLALILALGLAGNARAQDVEAVDPPQPVADPARVEVIEFFWYGCSHCMHFEPSINAWLRNKPADVTFIRQPAAFNARWAAHAKAYFTAEALGVIDKMHDDFFDAIQNKHQALESEDDLAAFFAAHGVKDADFRKAFHSFSVDRKSRQAEGLSARYGVVSTPTLIINGKHRIKGASEQNIALLNQLIDQERHAASAGR